MNKTHQLDQRFREVILNGTWVANTNFQDQLKGTDWKLVSTKYKSFNTIAAIAQHVHYYISGLNKVFNGGPLEVKDKYSFDFPPIQSQNQWETFLTKFRNDSEEFASHVEKMPDKKLSETFVEEKYGTYQRNIEGIIEHSYYHLGQVVLMKKMFKK